MSPDAQKMISELLDFEKGVAPVSYEERRQSSADEVSAGLRTLAGKVPEQGNLLLMSKASPHFRSSRLTSHQDHKG